jgi:sulfite exporter TauE/SafE
VPLALVVGLNPCVLVLPILVATAEKGAATVMAVTLAYSATTVLLMVGLSVAGVAGARRLPVPAAARHMEAASGLLIALVGAAVLLIDR